MSITKETQNFDSIDFSGLNEETETDGRVEDSRLPVNHHSVDMDAIQPHLSLPPPPSKTSRRNQRERGVVMVDEDSYGERTIHSSVSVEYDGDERPDGDVTFSKNFTKADDERTYDNNSNHMTGNQNGYTPDTSPTTAGINNGVSASANPEPNSQITTADSSLPVQICYSKNSGNISVREGQVSSVGQDGTRYITTQQIAEQWDPDERKPLRKKRIRWIKIFSIISCFLFFPTGIPAAYFAFRVEKEFQEGILRGNIDRAQRFATRSERLCILSAILFILVGALVVTLIERPTFENDHHYRGTVTG